MPENTLQPVSERLQLIRRAVRRRTIKWIRGNPFAFGLTPREHF